MIDLVQIAMDVLLQLPSLVTQPSLDAELLQGAFHHDNVAL